MRVLVACEYSGTVRDAFARRGHDAWSCDILPTEAPGNHIQGDALEAVRSRDWDLLIAHPPCTYISFAGTAHWNERARWQKRLEALQFFGSLWDAPVERICIENPKSCASPVIAKYTQQIQPFHFGDSAYKTTWLWLKNLPVLRHYEQDTLFDTRTAVAAPEPIYVCKNGKKIHHTDAFGAAKDRAKNRAKFWPGIANAMAEQWG
jgi:hypothetical protein